MTNGPSIALVFHLIPAGLIHTEGALETPSGKLLIEVSNGIIHRTHPL
jgi:hypothetical protein